MYNVLLLDALPSLVVTSEPSPSLDIYCPGQVVFTCNATDITVILRWKLNNNSIGEYTFNPLDEYPLNLTTTSPLIDSIQVINATADGNSLGNIVSELRVSNISAVNGSSFHCEDSLRESIPVHVLVAAIRQGMHNM